MHKLANLFSHDEMKAEFLSDHPDIDAGALDKAFSPGMWSAEFFTYHTPDLRERLDAILGEDALNTPENRAMFPDDYGLDHAMSNTLIAFKQQTGMMRSIAVFLVLTADQAAIVKMAFS